MTITTMRDLAGTRWVGTNELWFDPLGDQVNRSDATLEVDADGATVRYTWSHEGKPCQGRIALTADGAEFSDSWHQTDAMVCTTVPDAWAIFTVLGRYMGPWGWRIALAFREPTGELVLQMTNIAPWGEEARAVRLVGRKDDAA